MRVLFVFIILLVAGSLCAAQEYTFKVLISKGGNTIKSGDDWVPIQVGATLGSTDELRVLPNGYLGLVHKSGKPLEVKEAGAHKVLDLATRIKAGKSVLNKYTDFILSAKEEAVSNLTATGAVTRGAMIKLYLPDAKKAIVYNDEVAISWSKVARAEVYIVQISSMFGDELDRRELQDTTVTIDLSKPKFAKEDNIIVRVFSRDDTSVSSEEAVLKKISQADRKRLAALLRETQMLVAEKNALNELYLANIYEENMLLIDASTAYQNAIKMAPQVPDFQEAFRQFVARNAFER